MSSYPIKKTRKRFVLSGRNEYDGMPQYFCFDFYITYNRHGNIEVNVARLCGSFVPFSSNQRYVFNRQGKCISHLPGKRDRKVTAELIESHT